MSSSPSRFQASVEETCAQLQRSSYEVVENIDTFKICNLTSGVVILHAIWSGPSQKALSALAGVLRAHRCCPIPLHVIDSDCLTEQFIHTELPSMPAGRGETYWIRGGDISGQLSNYDDTASDELSSLTDAIQ